MRIFTFLLITLLASSTLFGQVDQKHRVIMLTNIEADPDDTQSLVRLLLYSNEIDIKGLVAITSCWLRIMVNPASIEKVIQAYDKVHPNLLKHDKGEPQLLSYKRIIVTVVP